MHIPKLTPAALNHHLRIQFPSLREGRRVFPHKQEDGSGFEQLDLSVFREDKIGCFTPLSGVFPSVFVQAVWWVVDLTKEG